MADPSTQGHHPVLRVGAKTDVKDLAVAVAVALAGQQEVQLRAVGAAAVNQAVKAVAIAGALTDPDGRELCVTPCFSTVEMPDAVVTALVLDVRQHPSHRSQCGS